MNNNNENEIEENEFEKLERIRRNIAIERIVDDVEYERLAKLTAEYKRKLQVEKVENEKEINILNQNKNLLFEKMNAVTDKIRYENGIARKGSEISANKEEKKKNKKNRRVKKLLVGASALVLGIFGHQEIQQVNAEVAGIVSEMNANEMQVSDEADIKMSFESERELQSLLKGMTAEEEELKVESVIDDAAEGFSTAIKEINEDGDFITDIYNNSDLRDGNKFEQRVNELISVSEAMDNIEKEKVDEFGMRNHLEEYEAYSKVEGYNDVAYLSHKVTRELNIKKTFNENIDDIKFKKIVEDNANAFPYLTKERIDEIISFAFHYEKDTNNKEWFINSLLVKLENENKEASVGTEQIKASILDEYHDICRYDYITSKDSQKDERKKKNLKTINMLMRFEKSGLLAYDKIDTLFCNFPEYEIKYIKEKVLDYEKIKASIGELGFLNEKNNKLGSSIKQYDGNMLHAQKTIQGMISNFDDIQELMDEKRHIKDYSGDYVKILKSKLKKGNTNFSDIKKEVLYSALQDDKFDFTPEKSEAMILGYENVLMLKNTVEEFKYMNGDDIVKLVEKTVDLIDDDKMISPNAIVDMAIVFAKLDMIKAETGASINLKDGQMIKAAPLILNDTLSNNQKAEILGNASADNKKFRRNLKNGYEILLNQTLGSNSMNRKMKDDLYNYVYDNINLLNYAPSDVNKLIQQIGDSRTNVNNNVAMKYSEIIGNEFFELNPNVNKNLGVKEFVEIMNNKKECKITNEQLDKIYANRFNLSEGQGVVRYINVNDLSSNAGKYVEWIIAAEDKTTEEIEFAENGIYQSEIERQRKEIIAKNTANINMIIDVYESIDNDKYDYRTVDVSSIMDAMNIIEFSEDMEFSDSIKEKVVENVIKSLEEGSKFTYLEEESYLNKSRRVSDLYTSFYEKEVNKLLYKEDEEDKEELYILKKQHEIESPHANDDYLDMYRANLKRKAKEKEQIIMEDLLEKYPKYIEYKDTNEMKDALKFLEGRGEFKFNSFINRVKDAEIAIDNKATDCYVKMCQIKESFSQDVFNFVIYASNQEMAQFENNIVNRLMEGESEETIKKEISMIFEEYKDVYDELSYSEEGSLQNTNVQEEQTEIMQANEQDSFETYQYARMDMDDNL